MELEIGTAETLEDNEPRKAKKKSFSGGSGSGNNGNRGGGGGGGDRNDGDNHPEQEEFVPQKYRVGMWIVLVLVLMTFSALISSYVVIAANRESQWKPISLPFQIWISTVLLLFSSITIEFARQSLHQIKQEAAKRWLLVTTILGGMFVASQLLSWWQLIQNGVLVEGNPYAGFFYIMTAAHGIHLLGGIIALSYLVLRVWFPTRNSDVLFKRQTITGVVSLYWHTMDGLWLILLGLLIFWK